MIKVRIWCPPHGPVVLWALMMNCYAVKKGPFSYLNLVNLQAGISSKWWQKLLHTLFTKLFNPFTDCVKSKDLILVQVQSIALFQVLTHYSDLLIFKFSNCFLRNTSLKIFFQFQQ